MTSIRFTPSTLKDIDEASAWIAAGLPPGPFRRILIKPNWVKHEEDPAFPIDALVTSPALLDAVLTACLRVYPTAEQITVGDVPLQTCDWLRLCRQAGIADLAAQYASLQHPVIRFLDLRRERYAYENGFLRKMEGDAGDPAGYREVILDEDSQLDPVSDRRAPFRVSDYDPRVTASSHRRHHHRYLIAGSILDADLFINVPKMKTHQKAGITGALKNLVGINGEKAYLAHHRMGSDEFPPDAPRLVRIQVRVRDLLQKRGPFLFALARSFWRMAKRTQRIATRGTREQLLAGRVYVGSGSWYGNDTIWRMVYDLNRIVRYAPAAGGRLANKPRRRYVSILDAVVSGEGNGPLQPLPVKTGLLAMADDPFVMDMAMAHIMGFDPHKIPTTAHRSHFPDPEWGRFEPETVSVDWCGRPLTGLSRLPCLHNFLAPPGWRHHIEAS